MTDSEYPHHWSLPLPVYEGIYFVVCKNCRAEILSRVIMRGQALINWAKDRLGMLVQPRAGRLLALLR